MPKQRKNEAVWIESRQRWQVNVQVDGRRKTFCSSTPGRKGKIESERKADQWINDGASDDPRFETLWGEFLVELKRTTGTGNYENHESAGRLWILPNLKLKRLSSITLQDWQEILTKMHEAGRSRKYMQGIRGAMTACYNYARKRRLPLERPDYLVIPKSAPVGQRNILQPGNLKRLFSIDWIERYGKQPCFFIHAWRFLVLTGMRRGELCGLRTEDRDGSVLYIRRAFNEQGELTQGKTKNAQRYIVLSPRMEAVLYEQETMLKKKGIITPWLFPDESGECLSGIHLYKKWATYRDQHDMNGCSLHELRHTLISAVKADVPEALLKTMVGHSKAMDTHGIYAHKLDDDALRASQLVSDVFDRLLSD